LRTKPGHLRAGDARRSRRHRHGAGVARCTGRMQRARVRPGQEQAQPVTVVVGAQFQRRAEVAATETCRDDLRGRALQKHQVVGARGFFQRPRHVHDAEIERDGKWPALIVEAVIGQERVLDP
jgi:hypothetical protein